MSERVVSCCSVAGCQMFKPLLCWQAAREAGRLSGTVCLSLCKNSPSHLRASEERTFSEERQMNSDRHRLLSNLNVTELLQKILTILQKCLLLSEVLLDESFNVLISISASVVSSTPVCVWGDVGSYHQPTGGQLRQRHGGGGGEAVSCTCQLEHHSIHKLQQQKQAFSMTDTVCVTATSHIRCGRATLPCGQTLLTSAPVLKW